MNVEKQFAQIAFFPNSILCRGSWTVSALEYIETHLSQISHVKENKVVLDGHAITAVDSAGALLINRLIDTLKQNNKIVELVGFNNKHLILINFVQDNIKNMIPSPSPEKLNILAQVGLEFDEKVKLFVKFLNFLGETFEVFYRIIFNPSKLAFKHVLSVIYDTGAMAMPIVALLIFLIGLVLAYQVGLQLETYGANIYIVDFSGIAILREFAPLITAVIVAGRTSSSFTALIGTMKINEELDALNTMGVSPTERLVIPRILGLLIALPLLSFWADLFGMLGSMFMAKSMLGVGYHDFLVRLQKVIEVKHYIIGLVKAPVFAIIIAMVGCFHGYQVAMNADSVGLQTTRSVVQAIFLIIIADAVFSVIFSWKGI